MFRPVHISLLWALSVVALATSCSREQSATYTTPLQRFAPDPAGFQIALPELGHVRDELLTLIINMDGMEGVIGLIEGATGVDLADEELFDHAGLDQNFPPAVFQHMGGTVICLGVADEDDFIDYVYRLGEKGKNPFTRLVTEGPVIHRLGESVALAIVDNLGVVVHRPEGGAESVLASLLLSQRPETAPETGQNTVQLAFPVPHPRFLEDRFMADLPGLGPFAGIALAFLRHLDDCSAFDAEITPGDKYQVKLAARGCVAPFDGRGRLHPEKLVPDDTVLLVHANFKADSLWALLPGAFRAALELSWQAIPAKKRPAKWTSAASFLQRLEPELALAFLGFSPSMSLKSFSKPSTPISPLFALHLQLLLNLKEDARMDELFDEKAMAKLIGKVDTEDIGAGNIKGIEYCQTTKSEGKRCFSVVMWGRNLALVTGGGEGTRLVGTLQGRGKTLAKAMFARLSQGSLVITLKTRRLVRDLMNKGFPPYFLQVLSSVLEIRLAADSQAGDTIVDCEVVLR